LLKRRILAHLEEAAARAKLRRWKRWAILSPLAAALLLVVVFAQRPAAFETQVNTGLAVGKERFVGKEDKSPKSNWKLTISSRHQKI